MVKRCVWSLVFIEVSHLPKERREKRKKSEK
jgi:hypothetical protein